MHVKDILVDNKREVITIDPEATIAESTHRLAKSGIGLVVVCSADGKVTGVLSERDIVRGISEHGARSLEMKASELLTANTVVCQPHDALDTVMRSMNDNRIRHLPVVAEGRLEALISCRDVLKHFVKTGKMDASEVLNWGEDWSALDFL
jgi:CBS domain-containing protein